MKIPRLFWLKNKSLARFAAIACFVFASASSMTLSAQNLLSNPGFEAGLNSWTTVNSVATTAIYGSFGAPTTTLAVHINGGGQCLMDFGGSAIVEQIVSAASAPTMSLLRAGGYFGGGSSDASRLIVRFLDASGNEISRRNLDQVTASNRNFEHVLMLREALILIPSGTVDIAARIELINNSSVNTRWGAADNLFLEFTNTSQIPSPLSMNSELLTNRGFESGWAPGSPLSPNDLQSWEGATASSVIVKPYSNTDPFVPNMIVSCLIGGGGAMTSCIPGGAGNVLSDFGGGGAIRQRLDVRGNTSQFGGAGGIALHIEGFIGGEGNSNDTAQIDVNFLNNNGVSIAPLSPVGPVTATERNFETVVVRREQDYLVPGGTAYIEITVTFTNFSSVNIVTGLADNISAKLTTFTLPAPVALGINLISNGSFESGSLPGSPLELTNPQSWRGIGPGSAQIPSYGSITALPSVAFAAGANLGGLLLRDFGGNAAFRQSIDLSGSQASIAAGNLSVDASAWLGGIGFSNDQAEVVIRFENFAGVQVGGTGGLHRLGPVTAAQRGNISTLLRRTSTFLIPVGAFRMVVDLICTNFSSVNITEALADEIVVSIFDINNIGILDYPGSGEDFRLLSGINLPPTTGPNADRKTAVLGDVMNFQLLSPSSSYDYVPIILIANLFVTGSPPAPAPASFVAGLAFDPFVPGTFIILNGTLPSCVTPISCALVLPGGTNLNFVAPNLAGFSVILQGLAVPDAANPTVTANNGFFATTEGHIIDFQ